MLRVAILGATGRMGQTLLRLIAADSGLKLSGAASEPGHPAVGEDAGVQAGLPHFGVEVSDDPEAAVADAQVAVDFTLPAAVTGNLAACEAGATALVMGTTGLGEAEQQALERAAAAIPIVYGRNMSVGVNLASELVRLAARTLGPEYDIEIYEAHHRNKVDAPSGTALQLGEAAAQGRSVRLEDVADYARQGLTGVRQPGRIGFAALRAGSIVGDHHVMFAADEEILEIRHRALDRQVFARGALRAARWIVERPPGLYGMREVLGLDA